MTQYLMIFNALWKAKRMEFVLSGMWQDLMAARKALRKVQGNVL